MKPLPLSIQTFSEIHRLGLLYVDKTEQIHRLLTQGKYYFLSRPRRFGKSLLLSTIREIFLGSREMFAGLWLHDRWDWSQTHPVVHIGMAGIGYDKLGLEQALQTELHRQAQAHSIDLIDSSEDQMFRSLIQQLSQAHGRVVVLIDEYDKPLIDYLGRDLARAQEHRKVFKRFYSVLKDADPDLRFVLITGVSRFTKVSIFSDLNNLTDLTMGSQAADLVGITQAELEHSFADYLDHQLATSGETRQALLDRVRTWYNGYSWDSETMVYNPYSLLNFFYTQDLRNYWFETGTPTFLLELMKAENLYRLDDLRATESSLAAYDLEHIRLLPLLFQTGYLTIKERGPIRYRLGYPNREVQQSMQQYILGELMHTDPGFAANPVVDLYEALSEDDLARAMEVLQGVFARIPYDLFIANREAYYHSLLHVFFELMGNYFTSEVHTHRGRIDAVVQTPGDVWIMEFKLDEPAGVALAQIRDRGYQTGYVGRGKAVHLVGVSFSSATKGIADWVEEVL
ncbi:MAG: ATP-binding protein [Bacteroidia bacterium]